MIGKKTTFKRMNHHLTWNVIEFRNMLTPFATEYRCWYFKGDHYKIEFIEFYIFGIRVARWRL